MIEKVLLVIGFLVVIVLCMALNYGCREYRIDQCQEKGGEAVVPPWFSRDPAAVSCIEGRR